MKSKYRGKSIEPSKPKGNIPIKKTLDATHNEQIKFFNNLTDNVSSKEAELVILNKELEKINNVKEFDEEVIKKKGEIMNKIAQLETEIEEIKQGKPKVDYYLKAGKLLFEYYDNSTGNKNTNQINNKSILDFFGPKTNSAADSNEPTNNMLNFVTKTSKFQRADYFNNYLSLIDNTYIKPPDQKEHSDICPQCKTMRYFNQDEAKLECYSCGSEENILLDSDRPCFKDPPAEMSYFAYKRINHFNEVLSQFQAKESTEIPQDVYDIILLEMKKERKDNLAILNNDKVRGYLKKHKYNKYYEHIPHIINRLNGLPPPTMTPQMEEELRIMFKQIQEPFEKYCPPNRTNFLNYNWVLHKFCQIKGWNEFLECFPLLKSKDNLYEHEQVWKKICVDLGW